MPGLPVFADPEDIYHNNIESHNNITDTDMMTVQKSDSFCTLFNKHIEELRQSDSDSEWSDIQHRER